LHGPHTGENLADALINVIEWFNLGDKVQSITTDNATNMTAMVQQLMVHPRAAKW
jgi:hypothetical protein